MSHPDNPALQAVAGRPADLPRSFPLSMSEVYALAAEQAALLVIARRAKDRIQAISGVLDAHIDSRGKCCDLHGRNCEPPGDLCCGDCTEGRHGGWMDERGTQRFGHPRGETCSSPDVSTQEGTGS